MTLDSITDFYNNLFTIEIAVFGIIAAAIFVFLQIVYSQFSYREVYGIFKNVFLILFLFISVVTLLMTAAGSLLLSFPGLDPTLGQNIAIKDILRNWVMAFSLLLSFSLSLVLFAIFTFSNISYIRPLRVALLISRKIKSDRVRDFLLKKYGIPVPDDWLFLLRRYGGESVIVHTTREGSIGENHETLEDERSQLESKRQQMEKELSENKKVYEKVKKGIEHAQDPLEPLDALMLRAINNVDLATIGEIQSVLFHISKDFISNYKDDGDSNEWSPNLTITRKYLEYLTGLLRVHLSLCDRQKLDTAKVKILETTGKIAEQVVVANAIDINTLLIFWKEIADDAIGKSREIFSKIIQQYRELADYSFKTGTVDQNNWLNEIFRHLGWLGERLISQRGIEEKPLMLDHDYSNEYDELFEALLSFRYEYCNKYPTSYPLLFFDAIDVVFLQLVPILKQSQVGRLKQNIFDCLYTYSSFAEAAIPIENSRGAALATIRLKDSYNKLLDESLEESAKEAIDLLVRVCALAARNRDKLVKVEFIGSKNLDEYIMDVVTGSPLRDKVTASVREVYLHSDHWDSDWNFVLEMGKRLGTNFGFMFDWETGEYYPEDDPRRR